MLDGQVGRQLEVIAEVVGVAQELGVEVWLRGGWAVDFFLGEVTREHLDVDWFIWSRDAGRLSTALEGRGYERLSGAPPEQQIDFAKDGVENSFALLDTDDTGRVVVAGGPWRGEPWPTGMLDGPTGAIGLVRCAIIHPRAQIEIKRMMPIWVPGRPRRTKDIEDIARLEAALNSSNAGH
ncbi:nucleotidyltransferase domain-containing protein [Acrocarpospora phusangensis]|nr:hypothetical protein [Acrocarpospora phusangensis]